MPKKEEKAPKYYAKKYNISVLEQGEPKSINKLTLDIYEYEKKNQVEKGLFPFLKITR